MHKTRLTTLSILVGSLFHAKFFNLTGLGRALKTGAQERSAIRRIDRFLGNKRLQRDRLSIYEVEKIGPKEEKSKKMPNQESMLKGIKSLGF